MPSYVPCRCAVFLLILLILLSAGLASGQTLSVVSGNGQVVREQFRTTVPMVVQAKDAAGNPVAGVHVTWTVPPGQGTLVNATSTTDAQGFAEVNFVGTSIQPGYSFTQQTITATGPANTVSFIVTTSLSRLPGGALGSPPLVELISPTLDKPTLKGPAGGLLPAAVVVRVSAQSGTQSGFPIPNVGVRIVSYPDAAVAPPASCNGPNGLVLTDTTGIASCDLVLGTNTGSYVIAALAGEFQFTRQIGLQIDTPLACTYTLSASSVSFGPAGGTGSVTISAAGGCTWMVTSNVSWVSFTGASSGNGNGTLNFAVAANTGGARTAVLQIAGRSFTISQAAPTSGPLAIAGNAALPNAAMGSFYTTGLSASGGTPPYTWSATALPPGLTLNPADGTVSGTPTAIGNYSFTATAGDSAGAHVSQTFTLSVTAAGAAPIITSTSFAGATIGTAYQQALLSTGGCANPFSPVPVFTVSSGALPTGLSLQSVARGQVISGTPTTPGTFAFTLTVRDSCSQSSSAAFTITVTGTATGNGTLTASPSAFVFAAQQGSTVKPPAQTLVITMSSGVAGVSAVPSTLSGGNWLQVTPLSVGATTTTFSVSTGDVAALASGTYSGTITVSAASAGSPVTVPVVLTISPGPQLSVTPSTLTFAVPFSSTVVSSQQALNVVSSGGPIHYQVAVATLSGGNWLSASAPAGDAPGSLNIIVNSGGLSAGLYNGTVTLSGAGVTPVIVPITLLVTSAPNLVASPSSLSFTWPQNGGVSASQRITVASSAASVLFTAAVTTNSGGGWLKVAPNQGSTPGFADVSVDTTGLIPGTYLGSVALTARDAANSPQVVNVSLTVTAAGPLIKAVVNAGSFAPGPLAPGELITLFGTGLGPTSPASLVLTSSGFIDTTIATVKVLFDGIPAPLIYVSDTQVSAIVPFEVAGRISTRLQLQYGNSASNQLDEALADAAPAVFMLQGSAHAAALNQDGSYNLANSPAAPGTVVSLFATGGGMTIPASSTGSVYGGTLPVNRLQLAVTVAGQDAEVTYAGAAPSEPAGVLQINFRVPALSPQGSNVPVLLRVGDTFSSQQVTISVAGTVN